ncbi:ATP-binding cassette domain-containing protein [Streptomyces iconiensis]|uniref:ATP-binding cassette domain-containing protein n=1 Tax=Streptomyces iconiensis TaxID=1384038 RepID=A0ABT6ZSC3_9ACTN|nr:ATP-binding cassette domain-containing protein [Streptomyces iconiensis]MDJ1131972.1 ATP-binding cassette domain-containing protein [Streptomyces iconiensis]
MIRFENVTKRYPDGTLAVEELSFEVAEGELVTLVGPSGCGKTTTMKMVNRLIEPTSGRIFVNGEDISSVPPVQLRLRIGYVIQQVGLFPHKTVLDNAATVPHLLGWSKSRQRERARELLDLVGLDPSVHGNRYPDQLSGGQRQRVGVARALAADPPVLLMDEPFAAVDPVVRERLQSEFLRLHSTLHKTVLFVTHDIEEAVRLGGRMAVFGEGRIEQLDPPAQILGAPATSYVADFVGADRGLKRLSVTAVEPSDLEQPPVAHLDDRVDKAAERMREEGARWAVVLDDADQLHGWISAQMVNDVLAGEAAGAADAGEGEGEGEGEGTGVPSDAVPAVTVRECARRMEAWLRLGTPLKSAFSVMLQHDAGWVAVLDEADRFVGVLTPAGLHEALRRSVAADELQVPRDEAEVETIADA